MSPVQKVKETVTERINSGEINIGEEVVRSSYTSYTTNKENEVERKELSVSKAWVGVGQPRFARATNY